MSVDNLDSQLSNLRILIVDDNPEIHTDFGKILKDTEESMALDDLEAELFESSSDAGASMNFELDSAYQGQEALASVEAALAAERPYAMAFVDMRMPPGWDGVETIEHLWQADPELQICICTAYSDYSWSQVLQRVGHSDQLLILKKPFDAIEVKQLANALVKKWNLSRHVEREMNDLEVLVSARTRDLEDQKSELEAALGRLEQTQEQLLQAEKMASVGQLAAGVAHEINNPLGFINSNLQTLSEYAGDLTRLIEAEAALVTAADSETGIKADAAELKAVKALRESIDIDYITDDLADVIGESIEGAERITQIVKDLKDFSHKDSLEANRADVNTIIAKTLNVARNEIKYKADVVQELGELPMIVCYAGRLGQVFLNMFVNAAHAIENRGTITVRTRHEGENVVIQISDTGCGIPAEIQTRIFDPFFTTKEVDKGTGLGLNLAYNQINSHGGNIVLDSTVGEGTTFTITLPVAGPEGAVVDDDDETTTSEAAEAEDPLAELLI